MKNYNPEVTKYIKNSAPFAQPILKELREIIHKTCPGVEERIKWQHPHFDYKGGMCFTSALKERVTFGFWNDSLIFTPQRVSKPTLNAKVPWGFMKSVEDIKPELVEESIKAAMAVKDEGVKIHRVIKPKKELVIPQYVFDALENEKAAKSNFNALSPSHKREYVEWIVDAKTETTREKRISQMIKWVSEGKSKNWKYLKK